MNNYLLPQYIDCLHLVRSQIWKKTKTASIGVEEKSKGPYTTYTSHYQLLKNKSGSSGSKKHKLYGIYARERERRGRGRGTRKGKKRKGKRKRRKLEKREEEMKERNSSPHPRKWEEEKPRCELEFPKWEGEIYTSEKEAIKQDEDTKLPKELKSPFSKHIAM